MEKVKIIRGARRAVYDTETIYEILDAGFLCHVSCQVAGHVVTIPMGYGRKENSLYLHGSSKNSLLEHVTNGQQICIAITHLDGLVLARTLFDTSFNYRSAILYGKATEVVDTDEHLEGLRVITEHIVQGRYDEVPFGPDNKIKATKVVKFDIVSGSAKIREGGPKGDEDKINADWSGHIPVKMVACSPVQDPKFGVELEPSPSVNSFLERWS